MAAFNKTQPWRLMPEWSPKTWRAAMTGCVSSASVRMFGSIGKALFAAAKKYPHARAIRAPTLAHTAIRRTVSVLMPFGVYHPHGYASRRPHRHQIHKWNDAVDFTAVLLEEHEPDQASESTPDSKLRHYPTRGSAPFAWQPVIN